VRYSLSVSTNGSRWPGSGEFDEDAAIETATRLFWKSGYEATSMRDLADHTGMTTTSLYNALGDK
jgi:TetR/AcrR family transcriptional regulator, transcriptional repressor for nem operon